MARIMGTTHFHFFHKIIPILLGSYKQNNFIVVHIEINIYLLKSFLFYVLHL